MHKDHDHPFGAIIEALNPVGPGGLRVESIIPATAAIAMAYRGEEARAGERLASFAQSRPGVELLRTGPGTWLLLDGRAEGALLDLLAPELDELATLFDQGDGHALLRFHGGGATTILQKGLFIDVDTELAPVGASICSVIARINVIVWRDSPDSCAVAVPRSFADSFWHWFTASAAAEGIAIGR